MYEAVIEVELSVGGSVCLLLKETSFRKGRSAFRNVVSKSRCWYIKNALQNINKESNCVFPNHDFLIIIWIKYVKNYTRKIKPNQNLLVGMVAKSQHIEK